MSDDYKTLSVAMPDYQVRVKVSSQLLAAVPLEHIIEKVRADIAVALQEFWMIEEEDE